MRPISFGPYPASPERREIPGSANSMQPTAQRETFGRDRLLTEEAYSKLAIVDALQRRADLHHALRLTLQSARREFPLTSELHRLNPFVGLDNPEVLTPV